MIYNLIYCRPPDIGDGSEKTAVIIETVGTIDKPKLLKLSHAAILENLSKYMYRNLCGSHVDM